MKTLFTSRVRVIQSGTQFPYWSCPVGALDQDCKVLAPPGRGPGLSCAWCITLSAQCQAPRQKGAEVRERVTLRTLQGVRWVPSFLHILSYKCHKTSLGLGSFWLSFCLGGITVDNCPISTDRVNWWKGYVYITVKTTTPGIHLRAWKAWCGLQYSLCMFENAVASVGLNCKCRSAFIWKL